MAQKKKRGPDIGERAELVVVEIIDELIGEKKLFKHKVVVIDYVHAKKSCRYDQAGIDILIIFNTGLSLPLQIKKSLSRGYCRHLVKHPSIIWIFGVGSLPRNTEDSKNYNRIRRNLEVLINKALAHHTKNGD
ncbi:MAG: hypothetical protein ABH822_01785 [Patescibacteria group bacterium]